MRKIAPIHILGYMWFLTLARLFLGWLLGCRISGSKGMWPNCSPWRLWKFILPPAIVEFLLLTSPICCIINLVVFFFGLLQSNCLLWFTYYEWIWVFSFSLIVPILCPFLYWVVSLFLSVWRNSLLTRKITSLSIRGV